MFPQVITRTLATASATALVNASATVAALVSFTQVTTVLDAQRRVLFTPSADESANTFIIAGTNQAGNPIVENLAGANATTFFSNLDFKTVTSIKPLRTTSGTVSVGTNQVGSSLWNIVNWNVQPFNLSFFAELQSGAATFTVEHTYDDPNNLQNNLGYPVPLPNPNASVASTSIDGSYLSPVAAVRLTTVTGTGTLCFRISQEGMGSP